MDALAPRGVLRPGAKALAAAYAKLRNRGGALSPGVSEQPASARSVTPEIIRFLHRFGAMSRSWAGRRAAEAADELVRQAAAQCQAEPGDICAALAEFCAEGSERSVCRAAPLCSQCPLREECEHPHRRLTIKDLPETERPRERLLSAGEERLSDIELLAIIIGGGSGKETALDLAARLLSAYGSFARLGQCSAGELTRVCGIGPAKAARIKAALAIARRLASERLAPGAAVAGSEQLFRLMRDQLRGLKKETFFTLMLDTKHRIIRQEQVAVGSLNESVVHPREVFKTAISESAAKVIFVHNHPSGNPEPSAQDRRLTARLRAVGELVGIPVLDHIIVGEDSYFSFAEHGLLSDGAEAS